VEQTKGTKDEAGDRGNPDLVLKTESPRLKFLRAGCKESDNAAQHLGLIEPIKALSVRNSKAQQKKRGNP